MQCMSPDVSQFEIIDSGCAVESVSPVYFPEGGEVVYNLTIEDTHTYFANGILTHNCLIDDPHNEQDAISGIYDPEVYNKTYEWFLTGPRQRLQPGARIAVISTRWSKIDLIGRLLEDAQTRGGDKYKEIRVPALLDEDTVSYWPEYWPVEELLATKRAIVATGSLWRWNAQYMQALCLSTPIPTPSGWTTMGEISVGDYVIGSDGKPVEVIWKSPNYENRPCYRVYSDDGAEVVADENHLWTVKTGRNDAKFQIRTTKWLADRELKKEARGIAPRRPRPPEVPPWELPEVSLPVDPYILGVWLGDGDRGSGTINSSEADQIWLREEFHRCGIQTTTRSDPQAFGTIGLRVELRGIGVLMNKHIPDIYMRASAGQRLSLIQGLMDTDGTCSKAGECYFAQVNEEIARSVCELVLSLGGQPRLRRSVTNTRAPGSKAAQRCYHWRVYFYLPNAFRMPRKLERCRSRKTKIGRFLRFTKIDSRTVACIRVKNDDGIFLAGLGCLPTHNCPTSEEGALIKSKWWRMWEGRVPSCEFIIQAWDTASRTTQRSNYSVCTTWGVFYNEETASSNIILLDCFRDKLEFPELKAQALSLYREWEPDSCVIEQKSAGEALITEFRRMGLFVEDYTPTRGDGDKVARVNAVTDIFASGVVWMLDRDWSGDVIDECQAFPMGANDDIVDTVAMALSRFRRGNFISLSTDEEDAPVDYNKKASYY